MQTVNIMKLSDLATVPTYGTDGAACFDFYSAQNKTLQDGDIAMIATGLAIEIPVGYELQVRPRSGLSTKGITITNSPGTVDCDYRGEIKIICKYDKPANSVCESSFDIKVGDRIAQGTIVKVNTIIFREVDNLSETIRGSNGFGSTGK